VPLPPCGVHDVEPAHGSDLGRAAKSRTHTQDAAVFCVSARALPCTPRRRRAAPTGPKREPGAWRPRAGGRGAVGPRDVVAGLWARRRSGRGRTDRDGQALAAGAGRSRRRATALQSGPLVHLPDAAERAQRGHAPAGSHGRFGGAHWGLRCAATARSWTPPPCSAPAGWRTR
jgi:hypothetical protein